MQTYLATALSAPARSWRAPFAFLALAAITASTSRAEAQVTPTRLIGDSVSAPDSSRYSDISAAIERFTNGDVVSARALLETAKRKEPKLPPVGVMLAKMYVLSNNGAAVRPALEQSINDEASDPEPYLILAESTLQANQTIEADALFDKSVDLIAAYEGNAKRKRGLTIRAYRGRATVAERRQNWEAAEADLRVWLKEAPDDATARTRLGQALCMLDRIDEGFKEFVAAKELDEKRANPYVMVATTYERRDQQAEALEQFVKAYEQDPKNETTLLTYAQSLIRAGKVKIAQRVLQEARSVAPGSFNVWLLSGVVQRMVGDLDQAERSLMQALSISPSSRDAFDQIAQILSSQDDETKKARGLQFAATSSKLYPNNADVNVTLAWALYQNNRSREATSALRKALQSGGGALGADARVLVAKIFITNGQVDNARRLLDSAIDNNRGIFVQRAEAEQLRKSLDEKPTPAR